MTRAILIVDDEPHFRMSLGEVLRALGYRVLEARDGAAALELLQEARPDLIFSDWKTLNGTGKDFLMRLRSHPELAGVPVIAMTAYGSSRGAIEAIRLGAYDFVSKPIVADEILVTVERALNHAALHREVNRLQAQAGPVGEDTSLDEDLLALPFHESVAELEKRLIRKALQETGGNKSEASHRLRIHRRLLYNKIEEHSLKE